MDNTQNLVAKRNGFPPGSTDCHVHLYGPFEQFPAQAEGRFTPDRAFPVEDLFSHWDGIGIQRGVIVHAVGSGRDNAVTIDALRRFPDRLRATAILSLDVSDKELDELTDVGFRAVRINMLRQDGKPVSNVGMTFDDLVALAPRIAERGWHAQLWIESSDLAEMASDLETLPLNFVVDHMARTMAEKGADSPGFKSFCDKLKTGRYWTKISGADRNTRQGAPYSDTEAFMRAIVDANPERVVWGSDWPHVGHTEESRPRAQALLDLFFRCVPEQSVRSRILVRNAEVLYDF